MSIRVGGGGSSTSLTGVVMFIQRDETADTYALRSTVTSDDTQLVIWRGSVAPTIGSGYMLNDVDDYESTA